MPSFEINFEVFCGTCGAGLCNQSDTRKSRTRGEDQVTVAVCENCIKNETQPLKDRIEELEDEIDNLKRDIDNIQAEYNLHQ